mmetsp:Transcript_24158/g.31336  ORF Transcript_24158/g.31336 Transcript_24158/m.31336 type:complete len:645 (-) Transcript_24158:213-2147(-)
MANNALHSSINPFLRNKFSLYDENEDIPVYVDPAEESSSPQFSSEFMPNAIRASKLTNSPIFNHQPRPLPPTDSMQNLQAAIGSSLANAIDQLEITCSVEAHEDTSERWFGHLDAQPSQAVANHDAARPINAPIDSATVIPVITDVFMKQESRGLIMTNVKTIAFHHLLSLIKKYGHPLYVVSEFQQTKGVLFFAYSDIRLAIKALNGISFALSTLFPCAELHFCPLLFVNGASHSKLLLQNFPFYVKDSTILNLMSKFGDIQSFSRQVLDSKYGSDQFVVDFFDVHAAKCAMLELQNSPGLNLIIKFLEDSSKGKEDEMLGKLIKSWQGERNNSPFDFDGNMNSSSLLWNPTQTCNCCSTNLTHDTIQDPSHVHNSTSALPQNSIFPSTAFVGNSISVQKSRQTPENPFQMVEIVSVPSAAADATASIQSGPMITNILSERIAFYPLQPTLVRANSPSFAATVTPQLPSYKSQSSKQERNKDQTFTSENEFGLNIERILSGLDKRTTVMIRNIPNKYTQQMLLSEINSIFKGSYDFFYLPIDFKNRCNVGYAFINFIDHLSIPPFHDQFNGKKWKTFNSEKVCAITYARIQGKASMISRFQNSSLLEKEGQYRPLLFFSSGEHVGKAEPFPIAKKGTRVIPSA